MPRHFGIRVADRPTPGPTPVGIDPTGPKFREHYPPHAELIPDFFSRDLFTERFGSRRAKGVTSMAMFYDPAAADGVHAGRARRRRPLGDGAELSAGDARRHRL
ncbi:hypothetical protein [Streptomyces tubercidicus]|uniref:hypothetical protein n=1 Tax=Streptomyces tubercidicus TaxID=47759 RepID=UPI0036B96E28